MNEMLSQRILDLKQRIDEAETRLRLNEILHKENHATLENLRRRYALLERQVNDQSVELEAKGHHVDSFEKVIRWWISSLTFDR